MATIEMATELGAPILTPRALVPAELLRAPGPPTGPDRTAAGGGGGGGRRPGEGGPTTPEGPRGPEWLTSPERGRQIVEEIVFMRTKMFYQERYSPENAPRLAALYKELENYVDEISKIRNDKDPWNPYKVEVVRQRPPDGELREWQEVQDPSTGETLWRKVSIKKVDESPLVVNVQFDDKKRIIGVQPVEAGNTSTETTAPESADATPAKARNPELVAGKLEAIDVLAKDLKNSEDPARRAEVIRQLGIYFEEANRKGLFKSLNADLNALHELITSGAARTRNARAFISQSIKEATEGIEDLFLQRMDDPEIAVLRDIWEPYIALARGRLEFARSNQDQKLIAKREGEWMPPERSATDHTGETYWEVGNYPKYYDVTAENEEQFIRAKETFLRMIRRGALGKSPEAIYQHVENFKDVFGQRGEKRVQEGKVSADFMLEQRLELEAQLFVFGADYSNETYNSKSYDQFMTAMALHEGPARWTRLTRAGGGQVGAFTHMFDKDALMEVFTNPVGERGEMNIIAQHYLQDQIRKMAVERGMGIRLKDYNPNDRNPFSRIKLAVGPDADAAREKLRKANQEKIGLHMADDVFRNLYEGFEEGDAHLVNWQIYSQGGYPELSTLPAELRKSVELGRIQENLDKIRTMVREKQLPLAVGQDITMYLDKADRDLYKDEYEKAEANFDIAFQMQGAAGEKVRRGKGFLYVDKNIHTQAYLESQERVEELKWIEGEIKARGSLSRLDHDTQHRYQELKNKSKNLSEDERKSIRIGWILAEMKAGTRLDSFSATDRELLRSVPENERNSHEDHIPTYQAEKFVQFAETWTKIKYADDAEIWQDPSRLDQRLVAQIIASNRGQKPPRSDRTNFKAQYRTLKVKQARERAITEVKYYGFEAKLWDDELGADGQEKAMMLTTPNLRKNPDDSIYRDANGKVVTEGPPVKVAVDFQTAIKHHFARYTTHTYWGYQGENRHMILRDDVIEAAKRIQKGESRAEDEDILAGLLLTVDPTLCRVKKFDEDQETEEIALFQAAVEDSVQSRQRIVRELFKRFLPKDGNRGRMRTGYRMEDWGGMMRFTMGIRELFASQPARFARRLGAEIAIIPMYTDSMGAIWGGDGVLDAVALFADNIKGISNQGIVGQFGITKFIDQQRLAVELYNRCVGFVDPQSNEHVEGLYMKPTNNNESLHQYAPDLEKILESPAQQVPFLYKFKDAFGRLERVVKLVRNMYSDVRNAGGALWLENVDIFLQSGRFNPDIDEARIRNNTGTSRHTGWIFFDEFTNWLIDTRPGGGGDAYPDELVWNKLLLHPRTVFGSHERGSKTVKSTFKDWLWDKIGL